MAWSVVVELVVYLLWFCFGITAKYGKRLRVKSRFFRRFCYRFCAYSRSGVFESLY